MDERNRVVYVTADQTDLVVIDFPFGLISPPILELHRPMAGAVQFFYAECYRLPIPEEALAGTKRQED